MGKYRLVLRKGVAKDLRAIPKRDVKRMLARMDALTNDPRPIGCEKLSGQERYRVRQSVCRIIYEIVDDRLIVTVVKVGHRGQFYER